jgi:steroid 5-alpha reductase family enzyme
MAAMNSSTLLLLVLAVSLSGFAALFFVAKRMNNFGIVDIAWAGGFAPVAMFYGAFTDGFLPRRLAIATMAVLWSVRLGTYLARRVLAHHPQEDGRYVQLRRDWGPRLNVKMFWFFQAQGTLLVALSVPFLLAARNPSQSLSVLELAGVALWLIALAGETLADAQLSRFRRNPGNRGRVCEVGLWRVSRHPNYFFEWLAWVAFTVFAAASPWGWLTVYCPALMLFFLLKVTGIRYTEEQLLRSKGDAYRAYQRRTPAFVPWFPKGEIPRHAPSNHAVRPHQSS